MHAVTKASRLIHRTLLLVCFAMWFGGFGFYVSIVVPIGTDVLGSAFDQGMITRRVAPWINFFGGLACGMMVVESALSWKRLPRRLRWTQISLVLFMTGTLAALIYLHPMLDAMIDQDQGEVQRYDRFYLLHRLYLWVSTFQWIAGWIWLVVLLIGWSVANASDNV